MSRAGNLHFSAAQEPRIRKTDLKSLLTEAFALARRREASGHIQEAFCRVELLSWMALGTPRRLALHRT